jgi:hypothetical protein
MVTKKTIPIMISVVAATFGLSAGSAVWANPPAQFVTNATITSVSDTDYGGELVGIAVSQPVVAGCTSASFYALRDSNTIKGGLALATAALVAGRPIDLFVSGDCDTSGQPIVTSVTLH